MIAVGFAIALGVATLFLLALGVVDHLLEASEIDFGQPEWDQD